MGYSSEPLAHWDTHTSTQTADKGLARLALPNELAVCLSPPYKSTGNVDNFL